MHVVWRNKLCAICQRQQEQKWLFWLLEDTLSCTRCCWFNKLLCAWHAIHVAERSTFRRLTAQNILSQISGHKSATIQGRASVIVTVLFCVVHSNVIVNFLRLQVVSTQVSENYVAIPTDLCYYPDAVLPVHIVSSDEATAKVTS